MSTKHTPGPWEAKPANPKALLPNEGRWDVVTAAKPSLVIGPIAGPSAGYDARLIAAAPELLEALKGCFGLVESGELVRDISNDGDADWALRAMKMTVALKAAQDAIAKAEGSR